MTGLGHFHTYICSSLVGGGFVLQQQTYKKFISFPILNLFFSTELACIPLARGNASSSLMKILYTDSKRIAKAYSIDTLLGDLPDSLKSRALRYQFEEDAYHFLLGRILLKRGLLSLGYSTNLLETISYNEEGKPLLEEVFFSISHSQNLVACAISEKEVVGLDVEMARDVDWKYFRSYFSEKEWTRIAADKSRRIFYTYWTQKEAILKVNGVGLSQLTNIKLAGTCAVFYSRGNTSRWQLKMLKFPFFPKTYACLCTASSCAPKMIHLTKV